MHIFWKCNMDFAPCKGCDRRYPACHDKCIDYKQFKEETEAEKKAKKLYQMSGHGKFYGWNRFSEV